MQVSVEESGAIERKLAICVPCEKIESEITKRLNDVARQARIPGFRPGKAPARVVRQRFSPEITNKVVMETIQSSYDDALKQEEIVPAGLLAIDPVPYESGKDLEYVATVEVFPEIPSLDLAGVTIRKPVVEVTAADVDNTLQEIRKNNTGFVTRKGKAENGDRLTIDFEIKTEGKTIEGGSVKGHSLILGNREMPDEFEDGLIGVDRDQATTISITYPEEHGNPALAGKEVEFSIITKAIEQPELPELNDEFAKTLGIAEGGMDKMKQEVEKNLSRELKDRMQSVTRERVMDGLLEKNSIELPKTLVESEIDRSMQIFEQYMSSRNLPVGNLSREDHAEKARRRVALSLIVRAIIDKREIKVEPEAVKSKITEMAASYEQPEIFVNQYMSNPEQLQQVEALMFEEQVVELMLETATVEEEKVSFRDFMDKRDVNTGVES